MLVCGLSDGLVCVLDLRSSRVVRCVNVGRRVTAVEVVSGGGGGGGGAAGGRLLSEEVGRTLFISESNEWRSQIEPPLLLLLLLLLLLS